MDERRCPQCGRQRAVEFSGDWMCIGGESRPGCGLVINKEKSMDTFNDAFSVNNQPTNKTVEELIRERNEAFEQQLAKMGLAKAASSETEMIPQPPHYMTLREYQAFAMETAIYPERGTGDLQYPTLGLCGETGEIAEKVKKIVRDKGGIVFNEDKMDLGKEIGDVLWYLAALCSEMGLQLADCAAGNLQKLASRKERGKLSGSGDNR